MDSATIVAVVSIATAGITTGFGCMGRRLEKAVRGLRHDLSGAATGCRTHNHAHTVCRPRNDRVHCDLHLRRLHDSHLRQSLLEPLFVASRGEVSHAHRLVHCRSSDCQLPHPGVVVTALFVQAHSQCNRRAGETIAAELADADTKRAEAQKERTDFEGKNRTFDEQRGALLLKATDEAKAERERLIDQAKKDAESLRVTQADALRGDQIRMASEITLLAEKEVFAIARKALTDLATVSLEERVGEVFTRRLRNWTRRQKDY